MNQGLTAKQVHELTVKGKANTSPKANSRSYQDIVKQNVWTYFNLINLILFLLILTTGDLSNGLFIFTAFFNTCIGIVQECRAKKINDRLSLLIEDTIDCKRDGKWGRVRSEELVPGDLIRLKSGMQIPADGVVEEDFIEVNESMLTGEPLQVYKKAGDSLYGGTTVTSGSCKATITKTGKACISQQILTEAYRHKKTKSPLQEDLQKLLKGISIAIIPTGIALFFVQYQSLGLTYSEAVTRSVSAVIGMIPEGLVVLSSLALAVGSIRLSQKNVLVQDLFAIESLARVDTICVDKTGTLTKGKMKVIDTKTVNGFDQDALTTILKNYVRAFEEDNATSLAIKEAFPKDDTYKITSTLPFSSDRKYAGCSMEGMGSYYLGAVQFLFPCGEAELKAKMKDYTKQGCRTLVIAHSKEEEINRNELPMDLEAIGFVVLQDVLKENVAEILNYFKEQGVTIKVISGDDPVTVSALATQAGIENADQYADMTQNKYRDMRGLRNCTVFGRVMPSQKKAIVKALQAEGHSVAMIGDGVNDVPALKCADVSVAMASGASSAKDCAGIVLLDSDFGNMPDVLKEGRRVINNISRASSMYLVKTCFSILLSLWVILGKQSYPFLPIHLTILSTFAVGFPTFILQMEPSFERVKGNFIFKAFRTALPSSITIVLAAWLTQLLENVGFLTSERYNTILLLLTAYAYLYTLYKVYYPLTKLRKVTIVSMAIGILLSMILLRSSVQCGFHILDLLILVPGAVIIPVTIAALTKLGQRLNAWFLSIRRK